MANSLRGKAFSHATSLLRNHSTTLGFLPSSMTIEDMIIADPLLAELGEQRIEHLLDLMENPAKPTTLKTMQALRRFLKALEVELGEEHPAATQVRAVVSLAADSMAAVSCSRGSREATSTKLQTRE